MGLHMLPYELLQLIAGNLLPCYQCRFAMTSRHCYKYLYNDLLRWHVRKTPIPLPTHNIMNNYGERTLLFTGKNVILCGNIRGMSGNRIYNSAIMHNLSTRKSVSLVHELNKIKYIGGTIGIRALYNVTETLPKKYLSAYHQYLHKDILLIMVNRRTLPYIDCINIFTREDILKFLSGEDIDNIESCDHLSVMLL